MPLMSAPDPMLRLPPEVVIKRVFHDAYGFLWAQTTRGPIRWDADDKEWHKFDLSLMWWAGSVH